jgi:hypothetical protein
MKHTPDWQRAIAETAARKTTQKPCKNCGMITVSGRNNDQAAQPATADPQPLTWGGELAAALTGRPTYEHSANELHLRTDSRRRAPTPFGDALTAHQCGNPPPTGWHQPAPTTQQEDNPNEPPY